VIACYRHILSVDAKRHACDGVGMVSHCTPTYTKSKSKSHNGLGFYEIGAGGNRVLL
jgi:hypothetical protein